MLLLLTSLSALLLAADLRSIPLREPITSYSGQFLVHGQVSSDPAPPRIGTNGPVFVWLEPQVLAVMAERVKEAFYSELKQPYFYKDKAFLRLIPTRRRENPINILSTRFQDRWQYQVEIPSIAEQDNLLRGLLQLVMVEFTNRDYEREGEIPTWLFEGMHQEILNSALPTYLVSSRVVMAEVRGFNRVENSRSIMKANAQLSFHDLCFPKIDFSNPAHAAIYRANAHIALHELLNLKNGPNLVAAFLRKLPEKLNWQTSFLEVFSGQFSKMLDVEKWWALTCVDIRGRDIHDLWPVHVSIQKLQSVLMSSMEHRSDTNSLPVRREISLGELLALEDVALQREVMAIKSRDLQFLAQQLAPDVSVVAQAYRAAIQEYLGDLQTARVQPGLKQDNEQRKAVTVGIAAAKFREIDKHLLAIAAKVEPR